MFFAKVFEKRNSSPGDISLVFAGQAGQGLVTLEELLSAILGQQGFYVYATSEYMSRVRGGSNSLEIRVSNTKKQAFVERMDVLCLLDDGAYSHVQNRITKNTLIIGDFTEKHREHKNTLSLPLRKKATELGGGYLINTLLLGLVCGLFSGEDSVGENSLQERFHKKGEDVVQKNLEAFRQGLAWSRELAEKRFTMITPQEKKKEDLFLDGSYAVALGAVAGGCDFIGSYPMSPSTGVFTALAEFSKDVGIVVEQVEDEIAAVNMGLGAWYGGARAMISTSGGGFSLMAEGVSLAGMLESPMVFHIGQRPGPATGLPTQTEQGDLNSALYEGHGDFCRIILAPGTIEECFTLTKRAFEMADRYQVPVFILTDKYLLDTKMLEEASLFDLATPQKYITQTTKDYNRYTLTPDGLSPRGIPGYGEGHVCLDSDEHTEDGRITESHEVRVRMMDKRLNREKLIQKDTLESKTFGNGKKLLILGWGSTHGVIMEALEVIGSINSTYTHVSQVYPVSASLQKSVEEAKEILVIENNATGQFADLLQKICGRKIEQRILKYDGMPFSVEELTEKIQKYM